jgi:hypothetical protein
MAKGFSGGFKALDRFRAKIAKADQLLLLTSKELQRESLKLIDEGFQNREDPSGQKWKRRKRSYPWPILNKTLQLRKGWKGEGNQHYFGFFNRTPYTGYHQMGTRKMVARKMVPDGALSRKWRARIRKAALRTAQKHFG